MAPTTLYRSFQSFYLPILSIHFRWTAEIETRVQTDARKLFPRRFISSIEFFQFFKHIFQNFARILLNVYLFIASLCSFSRIRSRKQIQEQQWQIFEWFSSNHSSIRQMRFTQGKVYQHIWCGHKLTCICVCENYRWRVEFENAKRRQTLDWSAPRPNK